MDDTASAVNIMAELPEETREFLAQLREDDIKTLKAGVKLVNAIQTVGTFFKWVIVGIIRGVLTGPNIFVNFDYLARVTNSVTRSSSSGVGAGVGEVLAVITFVPPG